MRNIPFQLILCLPLLVSCNDGPQDSPPAGTSQEPPAPIMPEATPESTPVTAPNRGSQGDPDEILVTLGTLSISAKEFHAKAIRKKPASGENLSEEEKNEVLDGLIVDLVLTQAAREAGLLSHPQAESKIVSTLIQQEVLQEVDALRYEESELKVWYEANRKQMIHPEQVQMAMISLKGAPKRTDMEALSRLQALHKQLTEKPKLFSSLATQHSEDLWGRRKGVVGWVPRSGKVGIEKQVLEQAFSQEVGQLSEPIQTSRGWALVKTLAYREAKAKSWEASKGDVMRAMKEEKVEIARSALLARLTQEAQIENRVSPDSLEIFGKLDDMPDTVLTTVNGAPITHAEFAGQASRSFPPGTSSLNSAERAQVLDELIEFQLLLHEGKRRGLDTDDRVEKKLRDLLKATILNEQASTEITESEMLEYFHQHPEEFTQAPRVQLRRILLKINQERSESDALSLIQSIRRSVVDDPDQFMGLAKTHSEDQYAGSGGFMGWVNQRPRPSLSAEDLEVIFALDKGEISEPIVSDKSIVLFQVVQTAVGRQLRYEDAMGTIRQKIGRMRKTEILEQYQRDARTAQPVVIDSSLVTKQVVVYAQPPNMVLPGSQPGAIPGSQD